MGSLALCLLPAAKKKFSVFTFLVLLLMQQSQVLSLQIHAKLLIQCEMVKSLFIKFVFSTGVLWKVEGVESVTDRVFLFLKCFLCFFREARDSRCRWRTEHCVKASPSLWQLHLNWSKQLISFLQSAVSISSFIPLTLVGIDLKYRLAAARRWKHSLFFLFPSDPLVAAFPGEVEHTLRTAMNNVYFGTFDLLLRCCHGETWHWSLLHGRDEPACTEGKAAVGWSKWLGSAGFSWVRESEVSGCVRGSESVLRLKSFWSWPVGGGTFPVSQTLCVALRWCVFYFHTQWCWFFFFCGFLGRNVQIQCFHLSCFFFFNDPFSLQ